MKTIKDIKNEGRLLYQYIAGSTLYHCNTEDSDIDTKGMYIATQDQLYGLGFDKQFRDKWKNSINLFHDQVSDERNDNVLYEVGKYMGMLLSSNANVLESMYVPEDMMLVKPHQCLDGLFSNRDKFITKDCFRPFVQYAIEQIRKARGLNKLINWDKDKIERKGILDFTYTFFNQGSTKIENWLEYRGLKQGYCGLVNIPNMHDIYGVYYDWGRFFEEEGIMLYDLLNGLAYMGSPTKDIVAKLKETDNEEDKKACEQELKLSYLANMSHFIVDFYGLANKSLEEWYVAQKPIGYRGLVGEDSQQLRLSSVSKGEKPICYVSYNQDGYVKHCIDYKNYKEWEKNRNPKRYESNLNHNYDSKNLYHSVRLVHMGIEIAKGDGIILDRRVAGDRDLLMDIRNHKFEYEEIMGLIDKEEKELNDAIEKSTLPEHIDVNLVNDVLIDIRKKYYSMS